MIGLLRRLSLRVALCTTLALAATTLHAQAVTYKFDLPAQSLADALRAVGRQTSKNVLFDPALVEGLSAPALRAELTATDALNQLLGGTKLSIEDIAPDTVLIQRANSKDDAPTIRPSESSSRERIELEEIVVTGTHIRGNSNESSPVQVYSRDQIDQTGFATVNQFLQTVPQNFGGGVNENAADIAAAPGGSFTLGTGANLRGLGSTSTLTLLNGHRLAPDGFGDFVDISGIPVSAIERIEVQTDGASAIYGSDAVAGVVNIIMRDDYEGAESRLRYGIADGFTERQAGQTFGKHWKSGRALAAYEYYDRGELQSQDRDYASDAIGGLWLLPKLQRQDVLLSGSQELTERIELFGFGTYDRRDTESKGRFFFSQLDIKHLGGTGGARFAFGSWRAELTGSYHKSQANTRIFDASNLLADDTFTATTKSGDIQADGPLFGLPGGDVKAAIGAHLRTETSKVGPRSEASRDIEAAYAELLIPIVGAANARLGVRRLELTVAARTEHYSDVGETTNPKLGLAWYPLESWKLRGTYGNSFRAPTFDNLHESPACCFVFPSGFYPDPLSPTGTTVTFLLLGGNGELQPETARTWTFGTDFTVEPLGGLRGSITYFDIDYTDRVGLPGGILQGLTNEAEFGPLVTRNPDMQLLQQLLAKYPGALEFCSNPAFPSCTLDDVTALVDARLHNLAAQRLRGLDFSLLRDFDTAIGTLGLSFDGQYLLEFEQQGTSRSPSVETANTIFDPPKLRFRGKVSWHRHGWSAALTANFTNSYEDDRTTPRPGIDSWTTFDLFFGYDTSASVRSGLLKDLRLSLSVANLLDADPPFVNGYSGYNVNFDGANANALGRLVAVQLTKSF